MKLISVLSFLLMFACFITVLWNIDFIKSNKENTKKNWTRGCFISGIIFLAIWIIVNLTITPPDIKAKNASMKIEIRQKIINDEIISTDTVYVFTPKK